MPVWRGRRDQPQLLSRSHRHTPYACQKDTRSPCYVYLLFFNCSLLRLPELSTRTTRLSILVPAKVNESTRDKKRMRWMNTPNTFSISRFKSVQPLLTTILGVSLRGICLSVSLSSTFLLCFTAYVLNLYSCVNVACRVLSLTPHIPHGNER